MKAYLYISAYLSSSHLSQSLAQDLSTRMELKENVFI